MERSSRGLDAVALYVLKHWRYDPETGIVRGTSGRPIGVCMRGYLLGSVRLDGRTHTIPLHRAGWLLTHGEWPAEQLDHIDGVRDNNRLSNLREASNAQNAQNKRPRRRGPNLPPGVYATREGRFMAQRRYRGQLHYGGTFESLEDAERESLALKARLHDFQPAQRQA